MDNVNAKNPVLEEQEKIVESILFMMGESVSVDTLALAIYSDEKTAREAAERLVKKYEDDYSDRGMKIIRLNGKYQMVANNIYFKNLIQVAAHPKKPVITEAVLETLSIIAYKQPITKPEIEDIRGVKSDFAVNRLIEYGLIEERGRLDAPGRPIIFGTTEEFLLRFGLESTKDLPKLDPARMEEIVKEVEKEVSEAVNEPYVVEKNEVNNENVDEIKVNADDVNQEAESVTENFNQPVVEETSATDDEKETEVEENKESDDFEDYVNKEILIEIDEEEKKKNEELFKYKEDDNHINKDNNIIIEIDNKENDKDSEITNTNADIINKNINQDINQNIDIVNTNIPDSFTINNNIDNAETNIQNENINIENEIKGNDEECKKEKISFIKLVLNAIKKFFEKIINFFKRK